MEVKIMMVTLFILGLVYVSQCYSAIRASRHDNQVRGQQVERGNNSTVKIVCYYAPPTSPTNQSLPSDLNVTLCTHIIMFISVIQHSQVYIDPTFLDKIPLMKRTNPALKVLACNGGSFSEVLGSAANRSRFAESAPPLLRKYGLDGLDLDWEYPAFPIGRPLQQKQNFSLIMQSLRSVFDTEAASSRKPRLYLTAAVGAVPSIMDLSYQIAELAKHVDWVNLMTYDFHGFNEWLPLTGYNAQLYAGKNYLDRTIFKDYNTVWAANEWVRRGMKHSQVMVGVPTYGHTYTLLDANHHDVYSISTGIGPNDEVPYSYICKILKEPKTQQVWDSSCLVPYLYQDKLWISYDNEKSLTYKTAWIVKQGFGGVMVFSVANDDFAATCDGKTKWPLLRAINNAIQDYSQMKKSH